MKLKGLALLAQFVKPTGTAADLKSLTGTPFRLWDSLPRLLCRLERERRTGIALIESFPEYRAIVMAWEVGTPVAVVDGDQPERTPFVSAIEAGIFRSDLRSLWGDTVVLTELVDFTDIRTVVRASTAHLGRILSSHLDEGPKLLRFFPTDPCVFPTQRLITGTAMALVEARRLAGNPKASENNAPFTCLNGTGKVLSPAPLWGRLRLALPSPAARTVLKVVEATPAGVTLGSLLRTNSLRDLTIRELSQAVDGLILGGLVRFDVTGAAPPNPGFLDLESFGSVLPPDQIETVTRQLIREYNALNLSKGALLPPESAALLPRLAPDRFLAAKPIQRKALRDVFEYLFKKLFGSIPEDPASVWPMPPPSLEQITQAGDPGTPVEIRAFQIRSALSGQTPLLMALEPIAAAALAESGNGMLWLDHLVSDLQGSEVAFDQANIDQASNTEFSAVNRRLAEALAILGIPPQ